MRIPVDNYNNLLTVLQLQHYGPLLDLFDYHGRKSLAAYLVTNALDNETLVPTQEQVRNWSNLNNLYSSQNIIR
jgi:vacuolar protein sorting-associated protein 35